MKFLFLQYFQIEAKKSSINLNSFTMTSYNQVVDLVNVFYHHIPQTETVKVAYKNQEATKRQYFSGALHMYFFSS